MSTKLISCLLAGFFIFIGAESNIFAATTLHTGIDQLVNQITGAMQSEQKKRIAVMDFKNLDHRPSRLGMYLSETLITKLFQTRKFMLIDRGQLRATLKETGIRKNRTLDSKSAQTIGKVLGVDSLVIGTVADLVQTIEINARIISAQTGQITAVARSEIEKNDLTAKLSRRSVKSPSRAQFNPKRKRTSFQCRSCCEDNVSFRDFFRSGDGP